MLSCYNILSKNGRLRKSVMSFLIYLHTRVCLWPVRRRCGGLCARPH